VPHFGEDLADLPRTMFEVQPTILFTVPRYLQKFAGQILVGIANTSRLKRAVYDVALRYGRGYARRRWDGGTGLIDRALYALLHAVAFRPILHMLGLLPAQASGVRRRAAVAGDDGAMADLWRQHDGALRSDRDGRRNHQRSARTVPAAGRRGYCPGRLDGAAGRRRRDPGQCVDLFDGYWKQPELSRAIKDGDGWLRTGDIGEWSGDRLRLIDRARDFIVTAGGKTISPSYIENRLRASAYVAEAIVFGHARKYLTALIEIDFDMVAEWARSQNISYTGFTSLCQDDGVRRLLHGEIERANGDLARVEQIKDFRILPKALDPEEEGEPVTPTRKVKRKLMGERFRE